MKVLFLDIDGVLNSETYFEVIEPWPKKEELDDYNHLKDPEFWARQFDPAAVKLLNEILVKTGAVVVLSSAWRCHHTPDEMKGIFKAAGVECTLIDYTPDEVGRRFSRSTCRGHEIQSWLFRAQRYASDPVETYAIVDDTPDMHELDDKCVLTSWEKGLELKHVDELVAILHGQREYACTCGRYHDTLPKRRKCKNAIHCQGSCGCKSCFEGYYLDGGK